MEEGPAAEYADKKAYQLVASTIKPRMKHYFKAPRVSDELDGYKSWTITGSDHELIVTYDQNIMDKNDRMNFYIVIKYDGAPFTHPVAILMIPFSAPITDANSQKGIFFDVHGNLYMSDGDKDLMTAPPDSLPTFYSIPNSDAAREVDSFVNRGRYFYIGEVDIQNDAG